MQKRDLSSSAKDLPRCRAGDNECLPGVITEVLKKTKGGSPQMNLPPFEPLHIPEINIIQGKESNIAIELELTDVNLYGISTAVVTKTM